MGHVRPRPPLVRFLPVKIRRCLMPHTPAACPEKQDLSADSLRALSPSGLNRFPPVPSAEAPASPPPLGGQLTFGAPSPNENLACCYTFPRQRVFVIIDKQWQQQQQRRNSIKENTPEIDSHNKTLQAFGIYPLLGFKAYFWMEHFLQCWSEADSMSSILHLPKAMSALHK